MKTRFIFLTMIAAAVSFSCQSEIEPDGGVNNEGSDAVENFVPGPGKILAMTPSVADTKVSIAQKPDENNQYPVMWEADDKIILHSETNPEKGQGKIYTYNAESSTAAVFEGEPVEGTARYAVFPSTRGYGLTEDGKLRVSFGALKKQTYHSSVTANGQNLAFMPMWAKEGEGDDAGKFQFNNLCGVVSFRFNDYQEMRGMMITSVKISSKDKYIAGVATLDPADGSFTLEAESDNPDSDKEITIDRPAGLAIGNTKTNPSISDTGTKGFLIGLPAGEYPAGDLTVTITDNFGRVFTRTVTTPLTVYPGVDRTFKTLSFTFAYGRANCVVFTTNEKKSFDVAPRYTFDKTLAATGMTEIKNADGEGFVEEDLEASVLWAIEAGGTDKTSSNVVKSVNYSKNEITVETGTKQGNALVALKKGDEILWSWHIWVVDDLKDQKYTACEGTPTFQNMNLGATRHRIGNHNSIGLYYQYGRKDPFAISKTFTYTSSKPYLSQVELTETVVRANENKRMSWTIKNPTIRIISALSHEVSSSGIPSMYVFDEWLAGDSADDNWGNTAEQITSMETLKAAKGGFKTIYDPCPEGYRVPDMYYFSGLSKNNAKEITDKGIVYAINDVALPAEDFANGTDVSDDYAFYPNPGHLNQGKVKVGETDVEKGVILYNKRGYYWTINHYSNGSAVFQSGNSGTWANNYASHKMSHGSANNIRCLKIQ